MKQNETANGAPNGTDQPPVLYEDPNRIMRSALKNRAIDTKGAALAELTESVRTHGIIEPLIVRKSGTVSHPYELIAGERRWLAGLHAKLAQVPIIVRQATDLQVLELRTIENDQREDLTPLERAEQYDQLMQEYVKSGDKRNAAIERLAKQVGKSRSTVYEILSLIGLPADVKEMANKGRLPASHAALLTKLNAAPEIQKQVASVIAPDPKTLEQQDDKLFELEDRLGALGTGDGGERDAKGILPFRQAKQIVETQAKKLGARNKWVELAEKHAGGGGKVLLGELHDEVVQQYGHVKGGYVKTTDRITGYGGGYEGKTFEELIKKAHMPAKILAHDDDYKPLWLFLKKDAVKAIEASGRKKVKARSTSSGGADSWQVQENKRRELQAKMEPVIEAATKAIVKAAELSKPKFPWLIFLGETLAHNHTLAKAHAWKARDVAHKAMELPEHKRLALLVEHLVTNDGRGWDSYSKKWTEIFVSLAKYYGIDLAKMEKTILAPEPTLAKPKATANKKTGPLTAAGRKKLGEAMKARWAARRKDAAKSSRKGAAK
jgi:ParB/RepB/Spo0J family partition protein